MCDGRIVNVEVVSVQVEVYVDDGYTWIICVWKKSLYTMNVCVSDVCVTIVSVQVASRVTIVSVSVQVVSLLCMCQYTSVGVLTHTPLCYDSAVCASLSYVSLLCDYRVGVGCITIQQDSDAHTYRRIVMHIQHYRRIVMYVSWQDSECRGRVGVGWGVCG